MASAAKANISGETYGQDFTLACPSDDPKATTNTGNGSNTHALRTHSLLHTPRWSSLPTSTIKRIINVSKKFIHMCGRS